LAQVLKLLTLADATASVGSAMGGAKGDGALPEAVCPPSPIQDSPSHRLTLLEQVLVCASCSARRGEQHRRLAVSSPTATPRSRRALGVRALPTPCSSQRVVSPTSEAAAVHSSEDGISQPRSSALPPCTAAAAPQRRRGGKVAAQISPEVLCPTHEGRPSDDYEFLATIGSGAFGTVVQVRHRETGQTRACKALAPDGVLEAELADAEIAVLKSLNHPHIIRLHEVYLEEPGPERRRRVYLITELCEGGDLLFRIGYHYKTLRVPMMEGHIAYMMRQILSAIMYCHHRGIVHRDMKPDNILFLDPSASSPLVLIDFGLAGYAERLRERAREVRVARSDSLGRLARVLPAAAAARWCEVKRKMMQRAGTAYYMAPEMIIPGVYDQKADMFSIGVIFSELLTGWHPFFDPQVDDAQSVHAKIKARRPVRLLRQKFEGVSQHARDLCRRLLEKDPKRRLSAGQALAHSWFRDPALPSPYGSADTGALDASVFEGLRQYQAHHRLRRVALQLMARDFSESLVQEQRDAFMALDAQGDGLLSPEELAQGAVRAACELGEGEPEQLVAALGGAGAGGQRAGYREFIAALAGRHLLMDSMRLRRCFAHFDPDNLGRITHSAFERVLNTGTASEVTESEWAEIVSAASAASGADTAMAAPQSIGICGGADAGAGPAAHGGESMAGEKHAEPEITFEDFVAMMQAPCDWEEPVAPGAVASVATVASEASGQSDLEVSSLAQEQDEPHVRPTGRHRRSCGEPACC